MSIMTADQMLPQAASWEIRFDLLRRVPRAAWAIALAAVILVAGNHFSLALQSPGQSIKTALTGAAAEMMTPSGPQPNAAQLDAVERHFSGQIATIDAKYWPQLAVTLHDLDKNGCIEAVKVADRMEGLVVVQLDKYRSLAECTDSNNMTWWILP
jgi:hypothetical protein